MSRVVFWSLDKGMTGNTYSTIAISTLMSITHKTSSLLIQGNYNSRTIEAAYTPYSVLKDSEVFENANLGVSALIRLVTSNKLTSEAIQNYAKPVLKDRLDVLYGVTSTDFDGYNALVNNLPYITRKAAELYDLTFVDLPKTLNEKYIRDALNDADIVVCTINQDSIKLDEFFSKVNEIEELKDKPKIFVLTDYESKSKYNLSNIKIKYRVKDLIFVLPHNYIFRDAVNSGSVIDFFYRNIAADMRDYNGYFIAQTNEIVEKIFEVAKLRDS